MGKPICTMESIEWDGMGFSLKQTRWNSSIKHHIICGKHSIFVSFNISWFYFLCVFAFSLEFCRSIVSDWKITKKKIFIDKKSFEP